MISRTLFTDFILMAVLVALQVFVLNRITLVNGRFTPVIYPLFVMFYPFFRNKYQFLVLSFFLGLAVDAVPGTWGINASATTAIAYFRTLIFRTSTETSTDFFSFQNLQWPQFLVYIFTSIFFHQLLVQYLEFFKFSWKFFEILLNVLVTAVFSFLFILIYALAFRIKDKV